MRFLRTLVKLIGVAASATVIVALSGCTSANTDTPWTVRYVASVAGAGIDSVEYNYIGGFNGLDGLMSQIDHPKSSAWTTKREGGHGLSLVVTPKPGGIARCRIETTAKAPKTLATATGAPGKPVTCEFSRSEP